MYIFDLSELPSGSEYHFGGKAHALNTLIKAKLPIPQGHALAAEAFSGNTLKTDAEVELLVLIKSLSRKYTYAVRSSAIGEDGKDASFAGMYETITNVRADDILEAVKRVAASAENDRVAVYAEESGADIDEVDEIAPKNKKEIIGKMGVVIQRFISPDLAGVLFTVDPVSADRAVMVGNFVEGEGERLVSGEGHHREFSVSKLKFSYSGDKLLRRYSKRLYKCAKKISSLYGCEQDIEWAVQKGSVYILQSRPITTLYKNDYERFEVNDSLCGRLLLSKTNVGEIFLRPVSPATYGFIRKICDFLGFSMIANVCGQLYLNISGICSMLCSFGLSREKAYSIISEIAGGLPENIEIPIFPYNKSVLFKRIGDLIKSSRGKKKPKADLGKNFEKNISENAIKLIGQIKAANTSEELLLLWQEKCEPFMSKTFSAIVKGLSVKSLFATREKLNKICAPDLTDRLLSDAAGGDGIESLGILLALEDVIKGKMSKDEYALRYGHRHTDEMELILPYPYESPDFPENVISEYKSSGVNAYELKAAQEKAHRKAEEEFKTRYPEKSAWLDKTLTKYSAAVRGREKLRSDALRMFCMIRTFLLKAGELTALGEDVFMLYSDEVKAALGGDMISDDVIKTRRERYDEQLEMPPFPSIILGRFTPDEWRDSGQPHGYYSFGETAHDENEDIIAGVAGSCGLVEGRARVLTSADEGDSLLKGEILVVSAANVGWVRLFPKIAGLVTDIGAPLSHAVIVARELGIPAVVSCQYASAAIKTGDIVRVNGATGKVAILKRKSKSKK